MTDMLTRGQVAAVIGRSHRTVPRWTAARGIPRQLNERGWWLYPADRVRAAVPPEPPVPAAWRLHLFIRNPLNHCAHPAQPVDIEQWRKS